MTSLFLPAMTSQPSLPSIALQSTAVTGVSEEEYEPSLEEELTLSSVRHFWSSFPCPPPWKPALLTEVNSSKLGPQVTRVITDFLTGKCQLHTYFPGTRFSPGLGLDNDEPFGHDAETHLPESSGDITWCDRTCQLAIGCAGILMAMVVAVVALVCFTRVRRPHKMASARPSRQQLQLSTSTSDAVNWAEFSNSQIQFDEDMIYPPFRHRGLPAPPSQCRHPSCEPKWNCSSCSSCHPLMRMSPSVNACTHGYTAVYETIDDDDDDAVMSGTLPTRPPKYQANAAIVQNWENGTIIDTSCSNFLHALGSGDSSSPHNDLSRTDDCREEETGFNGDEAHRWPNYFELDHNYDQAHLNQLPVPNRHVGMKSFQSPHQQKWVFHPSLAPTTFGKSPPAAQMACNQLCATCVPSVVSMTSCENVTRQNGYIPNGKILNVNPHPQTLMCVSNVDATPHISSSYPSTNIVGAINSHIETESHVDAPNSPESRYYFNQGCDFPKRVRSDQSHSFCQTSALKRHSKEDPHLATNIWRTAPTPTSCSLNTQDSDSATSSPRHWCPTCQQVPLLDQFTTHRISAHDGSEAECHDRTGSSWEISGDNRHTQNDDFPNTKPANERVYNEQEFKAEENSSSGAGQNSFALDCTSHRCPDILQKTRPQDSSSEPSTGNETDHFMNDNLVDPIRDSEQCPRVITLHSMYFNKTSTA